MAVPESIGSGPEQRLRSLFTLDVVIAGVAIAAIAAHLILRFVVTVHGGFHGIPLDALPLLVALLSSKPLLITLLRRLTKLEFSSDLLAGISIVTSVILGEYLAGTVVVLMLSGGQALEAYAVRRASFALEALASRLPSRVHRQQDGTFTDVPLAEVVIGDHLVVFPHETCPVDGQVTEGRSTMNEAYLTGEPYLLPKAVGSSVLSGAINGEGALTIRATATVVDSRYAKIMHVMRESEQHRPRLRRLGDQIGAVYTPVAVAIALIAWWMSGDVIRFLSVLVVATPCPLLIAIPVAIIGSVSLAARHGIIIKDPAALEKIDTCRTAIFDKTGTLTYGEPAVTEILPARSYATMTDFGSITDRPVMTDAASDDGEQNILALVASLERYSRHPLALAVIRAATDAKLLLQDATEVSEHPGKGLDGIVGGHTVMVTSRKHLTEFSPTEAELLPPSTEGLESVVVLDDRYAATIRYRDVPRTEGNLFVNHLGVLHGFDRVLLVSGDRMSEVEYLAKEVGISNVYAGQSPEQKLAIVREERSRAGTLFMGDGINDAPALTAATVGVAFGQSSEVTSEAAGVVILDSSLRRVDELLHIGRRMRRISLESAIGGMALSAIGMVIAALGYFPPVAGAIAQEVIDILAVVNALRTSIPPAILSDYGTTDAAAKHLSLVRS